MISPWCGLPQKNLHAFCRIVESKDHSFACESLVALTKWIYPKLICQGARTQMPCSCSSQCATCKNPRLGPTTSAQQPVILGVDVWFQVNQKNLNVFDLNVALPSPFNEWLFYETARTMAMIKRFFTPKSKRRSWLPILASSHNFLHLVFLFCRRHPELEGRFQPYDIKFLSDPVQVINIHVNYAVE